MIICITECLAHVRHDVDAAHANLVVSLCPDDAGSHFGYARLERATPTVRFNGVAVIASDDATAPDPIRIFVRDGDGTHPDFGRVLGKSGLEVRRRALPLLIRVDAYPMVLRRIVVPDAVKNAGIADDVVVNSSTDDVPGIADIPAGEE